MEVGENIVAVTLAAAMLGIVAAVVAWIVTSTGRPLDLVVLKDLFVEEWRDYLMPEPAERAAYLTAVAVAVPVALLSISLAHTLAAARAIGPRFCVFASLLLGALLSLTFAYAGPPRPSFIRLLLLGVSDSGAMQLTYAGVWIVGAMLAFTRFHRLRELFSATVPARHLTERSINILLAAAVVLTFVSVRLRSADMIQGDLHFEAVFYSMSQVIVGQTLLSDLPAQYGLYAEMLRPVFMATGMSVAKFTVVLAFLQAIAGLALLGVCIRLISDGWVRVVAMLALCVCTGSTWIAIGQTALHAEHYQIWPIRFFFPAVSAFALVVAAHSDDRDRGFRRIATTRSDRSRPVWRGA